ncbi:hypothetical protein Tco_0461158 [Tanacetum coccineum]
MLESLSGNTDDVPTPTADAAGRAEDPALLTGLSAKLDMIKKFGETLTIEETRLVVDASAAEGDVDIQDDIDLDGLSRMASTALGHDQPAVPSEDVEEREEEEVPLRRKRSAYRRARTEFSTSAFEQFQANLSAGVLPHTAVHEPAGPSVAADKGKVHMPDLDIPAEFLAEDAQARKRFEEEQASERLVQRLRAEDLAQEDLPNVSEERAKELDDLMMRMTETITEEASLARFTYQRHSKGRLEKDRLLSAQYNLFRPKPAITEPPSKRQRVEQCYSQPASVLLLQLKLLMDPDSAGVVVLNPLVPAAMDSAGSQPKMEFQTVCRFALILHLSSHHHSGTLHRPMYYLIQIPIAALIEIHIKLPDDEIVDPRVKVETVSESVSSPPRSRQSESDDDKEKNNPPHSICAIKYWRMLTVHPRIRSVVGAREYIQTVRPCFRQAYSFLASGCLYMVLYNFGVSACTARQMVFSSPWLTAKKESGSPLQTALVCFSNPLMVARLPKTGWFTKLYGIISCSCWDEKWLVQEGTALELASPEQTATGKDVSNPLYGCDSLPKTVRVFQFTLDSRSEKLDWFLLHPGIAAKTGKQLFFDVATSSDSAVLYESCCFIDAAVTLYLLVFVMLLVRLFLLSSSNICCLHRSAAYLIPLASRRSRNFVPAGSSSSVPADYVSADRDRIC